MSIKCFSTRSAGLALASAAMLLSACASTSAPGPVSVSRFVAAEAVTAGTVFIETAPGVELGAAEMSAYKGAVARELARLGYQETSKDRADNIALVRVDRYVTERGGPQRSPVSVGVGGSAGSYGSGLGLGIGINLGGNKSRDEVGTELGVMLRDKQSNSTFWEGRAQFEVAEKSPLASAGANASAVSQALFTDFPGRNGETIEVEVTE